MDSDDDYLSFSPPKEEPSPQVHYRRLKRLKKFNSKPSKDQLPESVDDPLLFPAIDFAKLEALEKDLEMPELNDSNSTEETILSQESLSQSIANENEEEDELERVSDKEVKKTKRVLEFDDDVMAGVDGNGMAIGEDSSGFETEKNEKERIEEDNLLEGKEEKKKKKKRVKSGSGDELKNNARCSNKRSEEKERKAYLKELHAESQRLLRDTRDASFKPVPVVQKPISSVLEKIRKRKLEISKKALVVNERSYGYDGSISPRDKLMDLDVSNEKEDESVEMMVEKERIAPFLDGQSSLAAPNVVEGKDADKLTINETDQNQVSPDEEPISVFRAPVDDTQDLFDDSEPIAATAEQNDEQLNNHLEEDFAPSLLAMNLKFDSAPVDDNSSDDDNDKENVDPRPCGIADGNSSPQGDPVKNFVDDEAEEEDDSDNDLHRFQENEEDEDIEDFEELNDMIATECQERPVDIEKRNELHQKWLEQQDAAGTDNLMQKLKCGSALRHTFLQGKETETYEEDEEFDEEPEEDSPPQNSARVNTRKAKQIILQLFDDKEDPYLSDDDNDMQRRHAQRLLIRKEEQATVVSPAEDESSREVFRLIKKLNIVSDNKKKPKASSISDSMLKGLNSNNSLKSSFLGRVSKHPILSSHKKGSGSVRSFIFGRDDSNSRNSISMSEDSSDTQVSRETRPTRSFAAKYSNTQSKFSSQTRDGDAETAPTISLLDVLKRSSSQFSVCSKDSRLDLTKGIFAFRAPKKTVKIEGRS
ncbi:hypothetical protein CDL12_18551 [Handroanthus impetiginosus]|uniref:DNA replication checkpoint mediator MRC1 domain-containing protein n=1 Tax=Handroanthus impetiginosus TaxID=429701 RepID=A0A2G9GUH8_9LAMI|nr:hypothetical protein CDL12_18551 [Handroanthus impetiginosus]